MWRKLGIHVAPDGVFTVGERCLLDQLASAHFLVNHDDVVTKDG
jgi:hypothetical protein